MCVWWLAAVSAAFAEPERLALLIGNQSYGASVGELQNTHNDIALVGQALAQQGYTVLPLVKDATRVQILTAVENFALRLKRASPGAVGFVYYAGLGAADPETKINYLIPIDAKEPSTQDFWHESVKLDDLLGVLNRAPSAAKFVIFDACRTELRLPLRGSRGLSRVEQQKGLFVAFATSPEQPALDALPGRPNGPYATVLAAELAKPGLDHVSLFQNVKEGVFTATREAQLPWTTDGLTGRVAVTGAKTNGAAAAPVQAPPAAAASADQQWIANQDRLEIEFSAPVAESFSDSKASKCRLPVTVRNLSRYHLRQLSYKVGDWEFREGEMSANKTRSKDIAIDLTKGGDCFTQAAYVLERIATAEVNDCAMDGLPEGDCQAMVHISAKFGAPEMEAIRQIEAEAGKRHAEAVAAEKAKRDEEIRRAEELRRKAEAQRKADQAKQEAEVTSAKALVKSWKKRSLDFFHNSKKDESMEILVIRASYYLVSFNNLPDSIESDKVVAESAASCLNIQGPVKLRPKSYFLERSAERFSSYDSSVYEYFKRELNLKESVGITYIWQLKADKQEKWYMVNAFQVAIVSNDNSYKLWCSYGRPILTIGNKNFKIIASEDDELSISEFDPEQ